MKFSNDYKKFVLMGTPAFSGQLPLHFEAPIIVNFLGIVKVLDCINNSYISFYIQQLLETSDKSLFKTFLPEEVANVYSFSSVHNSVKGL